MTQFSTFIIEFWSSFCDVGYPPSFPLVNTFASDVEKLFGFGHQFLLSPTQKCSAFMMWLVTKPRYLAYFCTSLVRSCQKKNSFITNTQGFFHGTISGSSAYPRPSVTYYSAVFNSIKKAFYTQQRICLFGPAVKVKLENLQLEMDTDLLNSKHFRIRELGLPVSGKSF